METTGARSANDRSCNRETPLTLLHKLFPAYLASVEQFAAKIAHGESCDAETIHDFRIALRRIETVLTQFRDLIPRQEFKWFSTHFKKLRKTSNSLRDADIFLEHLETYHDVGPFSGLKEKILNGYQSTVSDVQSECLCWLATEKRIEHRTQLLNRIERLLHEQGQNNASSPETALAAWIHAGLTRMGRKVFRSKLKWKGWTTLHERRIASKRLRYAMELYRDFLPKENYDPVYRRLKSLQNRLGPMNDEVTICARLKAWGDDPSTSDQEKEEIERLREREKLSLRGQRQEFEDWWTPSRRQKWKKQWKELLSIVEKQT